MEKDNMKKSLSEFDRMAIKLLSCIVTDQKMSLVDADENRWESFAIEKDGLSTTTILKDNKTMAKIVYDYETGKEFTFSDYELEVK